MCIHLVFGKFIHSIKSVCYGLFFNHRIMGCNFLKNYMGARLDDAQLCDIPHCRLELATHIGLKAIQTGAVVGMVAAPLNLVLNGNAGSPLCAYRQKAYEYGRNGLAVGAFVTPLIYLVYARQFSDQECYNRAYRLRINRCTLTTDRLSILGVGLGVGTAYYLGEKLSQGALFGFVGGWLLGGCMLKVLT